MDALSQQRLFVVRLFPLAAKHPIRHRERERESGGPREKRRNAILKSRHEHKSLTRRFLKREALPSSLTPPPSLVESSLEGRNAVCLHAIALKKEETQNAKAP